MCRPWLAAGVTCFVASLLVRELSSVAREPEGSSREDGLLGGSLRHWFRGRIRPLAHAASDAGFSPDTATLLQLATSALCAIAYAHGFIFTAGWILIGCGTLDVLDGEMARHQGHDGPRGAFIDSVVDRYSESTVFMGLAV